MVTSACYLVCLAVAASVVGPSQGVKDGDILSANSWPWLASIWVKGQTRTSECAGTLIHPQWVLTTYECIFYKKTSDHQVVLGENDPTKEEGTEQRFTVLLREFNRFVFYYRDSAKRGNGVVLFKLDRPATLNAQVQVLPLVDFPAKDYTHCKVAGWAVTADEYRTSRVARITSLVKLSRKECQEAHDNKQVTLHANEFCFANTTQAGPCGIDRGAPVVCTHGGKGYFAAMVASPDCYSQNRAHLYNDVVEVRQWVKKIIDANTDDTPVG